MALDSDWGRNTATLNNPATAPTYVDSPWGRALATLTDPVPPPPTPTGGVLDSLWGRAVATLTAPPAVDGSQDSAWGTARAVTGLVVTPLGDATDVEPGTPIRISAYVESNVPILREALDHAGSAPQGLVFTGSSTTFGTGASNASKRYVNLVVTTLQTLYPSGGTESTVQDSTSATFTKVLTPGVHGYNAGEGGTTSANFLTSTERTNIGNLNPAAVFIMIGANDYANGVVPTTFKSNLATVLADLHTKAPNAFLFLAHTFQRLDVITPAYPWSQYRTQLIELAQANPAWTIFLDVGDEFAAQGVPGTDPNDLVASDAIHPTDAGHQLIADTFLRDLEGIVPIDSWTFSKVSGPTVELVTDRNILTFLAPSVPPPNPTTLVIGAVAHKGTINSAQVTSTIVIEPNTIFLDNGSMTYVGARPPVRI